MIERDARDQRPVPVEPAEQLQTTPRFPRFITVALAGRTIRLFLALAVVIWLAFQVTSALLVILTALLFATALDEPASWLERRGIRRPLAVALLFLGVLLVVAIVVAAAIPLLQNELTALETDLPAYTTEIERAVSQYWPFPGRAPQISLANLSTQLVGNVSSVSGGLTDVTFTAVHFLVLGFITVMMAYFLAIDPGMGDRLSRRFASAEVQGHLQPLAVRIRERIGAWVRGQIIVAVSFGAAMGFGLWALGVPYALSLGVIAAALELVPYLGGAVTVVLAGLIAASVSPWHVLAVIALYVVLTNIEAHVLSPLVLGHAVGIPTVGVLAALLIGVELLGILGALLAVPAAVVIWATVEEIWPSRAESGSPDRAPAPAPSSGIRVDAGGGNIGVPAGRD